MKKCVRCKEEKSGVDFYKSKQNKDGFSSYCKKCNLEVTVSWYKNNLENGKKIRKRYKQNNKEKDREHCRYRKFRLKNHRFDIIKKDLKRLYSSKCSVCESKNNIEIDHIIPLSRGGSHGIGNMQALCKKCNGRKGSKYMIEFKKKYGLML